MTTNGARTGQGGIQEELRAMLWGTPARAVKETVVGMECLRCGKGLEGQSWRSQTARVTWFYCQDCYIDYWTESGVLTQYRVTESNLEPRAIPKGSILVLESCEVDHGTSQVVL